jgi:hypothetical protein
MAAIENRAEAITRFYAGAMDLALAMDPLVEFVGPD